MQVPARAVEDEYLVVSVSVTYSCHVLSFSVPGSSPPTLV